MSQAGTINAVAASPSVATTYQSDSGTAVPQVNILEVFGTAPVQTSAIGGTLTVALTTAVPPNLGGTGFDTYVVGDLLYADTTTTLATLGAGTEGYVLAISSGLPAWVTQPTAALDHNDLTGLQGGQAGQYYHLTAAQHSNVGDFVVGPASATDNAIARYDSTTGKLIQDSKVEIDNNGNISSNELYAGQTRSITMVNNSNTSSTVCKVVMVVGGTSSSDMYNEFRVGSTRSWSIGVDTSDTQSFKVTTTGGVGVDPSSGTEVFKITAAGVPTFPQAPLPLGSGGTGATMLTGVLTGNGTSAVTAATVTEYGVLVGGASNAVASTSVGTAGQVLTSNGAGVAPTFATIQAVTAWTEVTATTQAAAVNNGYITNETGSGSVTITLPAVCAVGDIVSIIGKAGAAWVLKPASSDTIEMLGTTTAGSETVTPDEITATMEVICTTANAAWTVKNANGNFTFA